MARPSGRPQLQRSIGQPLVKCKTKAPKGLGLRVCVFVLCGRRRQGGSEHMNPRHTLLYRTAPHRTAAGERIFAASFPGLSVCKPPGPAQHALARAGQTKLGKGSSKVFSKSQGWGAGALMLQGGDPRLLPRVKKPWISFLLGTVQDCRCSWSADP